MERRKRPYSLYKRPTIKKNKYIYYVRYRDSITEEYLTAMSTGCSNYRDAIVWSEKQLNKQTEKREHITLESYSKDFFKISSVFAQKKLARGYNIAKGYLDILNSYTKKHILPVWGSYRLKEITPGKIDSWIIQLNKESNLAPSTINNLLKTFRIILDQATTDGWIAENPGKFIKPVKAVYQERGVFTLQELIQLIKPGIWPDLKHYSFNLLACTLGLRLGEIRGLTVPCIHKECIEIKYSWEERYGLKPPKFNSYRELPITLSIFNILDRIIVETRPKNIIFYSDKDIDKPLPKSVIGRVFHKALKSIGIDEIERKKRHLVFHSYRHSLNTILRSNGMVDSKIRLITGHKSEQIQDHYTHYRAEDFKDVIKFQTNLLGGKHE